MMLEVLVAVSGVAVGYWLVSVFLSRSDAEDDDAGRNGSADPDASVTVDIGTRHWSEVLGVAIDADRQQITAAWRRRIAEYHPDRVATMAAEIRALAGQRTAEINAAYEQALRERGD